MVQLPDEAPGSAQGIQIETFQGIDAIMPRPAEPTNTPPWEDGTAVACAAAARSGIF